MTSTEPTGAIIPARSRRQAMDWSLVLLSQGIECIIEHLEDGWVLLVEPQDFERASAALQQYEIENPGWRWRQELSWPPVVFHWGALVWCLVLAAVHWIDTLGGVNLESVGRMQSDAVWNGAWWRLFTAILLHGDLAHLMANLTFGLVVLGLAMARYGAGCALLAACLAGAGGNLARALMHSEIPSLGASGMVMGGLGLLAIQSLSLRHSTPTAGKYIVGGILGGFMLFVLVGLDPRSDVIAHLGGFVSGLILGGALSLMPQSILLRQSVNVVAGTALVALNILVWTLACRNLVPLR
jgi:membrane associated rhomboid family serine protease